MIELVYAYTGRKGSKTHIWTGNRRGGTRVAICGVEVTFTGHDYSVSILTCKPCRAKAEKDGLSLPEIWLDRPLS